MEEGEELDEIKAWSSEINNEIQKFNPIIEELQQFVKGIKSSERKEEERELLLSKQRQHEKETELEKARYEQMVKIEKKLGECKANSNATLPKLVISKFQGTHLDWYRFWNQFQAEIDNASIDSVTKFSYLKELLLPKVRLSIDGLLLTTEGYERAKKILNSTYGKSSEIINAYVQNITSLPLIKGGNAAKIQEFYEKLLISVQALESMGKLGEIKGLTRGTLDKLEGIRADLVRTDDNWQEWGFPKLVNALKQWTERNPSSQDDRGGGYEFP